MNINDVFIKCVEKWAENELDDRINFAMDKFDDWIKEGNENDLGVLAYEEEKDILCKILEKFNYYPLGNINKLIKELSDESRKVFGVSNDDSVISVVRKADGKLNSSHEYCQIHRLVSGLNKKIYYDSLDNINENDWENIKNVVFVDDCSGTGNQFVEFLKRQKKSMVGKRIILIAIEIVEDAKVYIDNYAKKHGIDIHIIAYSVKKKAFKTASDMEKNKFIEMSQKVKIDNKYILGFKNAEALMAFYNNSPNDTLGLFWFPSGENNPIFPRELEDEPGWKCYHKKKNERRRRQYETKCR